MKKFFAVLILVFFSSNLVADDEVSIMADPQNCLGCHDDIHADWTTSLHAKSHEDSSELYKKTVELVATETKQIYEQVLVSCGTCHNPRLETKNISDDVALASMLGIQTDETKNLHNKIESESVKNGISCFVCHSVEHVKIRDNQTQNGYKLFDWTKDDLIVGPYDLKDEEPIFHKSEERRFFRENNDLCLACHQGQATKSEHSLYNTGEEMRIVSSRELCTDCHMKNSKTEIIAPDMQRENMVPREIKSHFFEGARNSNILKNAIELSFEKVSQNEVKLFVKNLISHGIPSGFSGRSLVLDIDFLKDGEVLQTKNIDMRAIYKNALLYETLSYAAKAKGEDTRLKPYEKREISLEIPENTTAIKVSVGYFVIAPQLQEVLQIQNEEFTKRYDVTEQTFSVK